MPGYQDLFEIEDWGVESEFNAEGSQVRDFWFLGLN